MLRVIVYLLELKMVFGGNKMAYNWTEKRITEEIKKYKRMINELKWSGRGYSHITKELADFKKARGVK